jgi:smad nuclear-interacting protein 1
MPVKDLNQAALEALQQEIAPEVKVKATSPPKSKQKATEEDKPIVKEKVNFATSGKLAEDTNMFNGVVVNYSEPAEAKKPSKKWRLYPFKGDEPMDHIEIHTQSAFLLGRDRRVVDIPIDHPSCSKQHAAIQFRIITYEKNDGTEGKRIRPYLMDLESANGSFINSKKIESRRYYELLEKDVIKFGFSSREYVVLTEEAKD